jgi:hypothetical protein
MYFGEFLCYWCVYLCISAVYYIFSVVYCAFLLYSRKNTNKKHISGAPFLMSMAHPIRSAPKWGALQIICVAHALGCATCTTHIRGAYRRAPQIKYTSGLICVAHHRCATKPQNNAPQIGFLLAVPIWVLGNTTSFYILTLSSNKCTSSSKIYSQKSVLLFFQCILSMQKCFSLITRESRPITFFFYMHFAYWRWRN